MKKNKLVVFDFDGTLVERDDTLAFATDYVVKQMGWQFKSKEDLYRFHSVWYKEYLGVLGKNLAEQKQNYEKMLPKLIEFEMTEEFLAKVQFYKNVQNLLKELNELGHLLTICTSRDVLSTRKILEYYDIEKYICNIIGTQVGRVVEDKPSVKPVHFMMAELGLSKSVDIFVVGDGKKDVRMAKNLGAVSIGVAYNKYCNKDELKSAEPDFLIEKEIDIPSIAGIIHTYKKQR